MTWGSRVPEALGFWLWKKLTDNSEIKTWWGTLDPVRKGIMKGHYINYLQGIKDGYLGRTWQLRMNLEFNEQRFRQKGHEQETPQGFISRRIMYTRMLANADQGGPMEVFVVMQKAPIAWSAIIHLDSIQDSATLYSRVTENAKVLAHASRGESGNVVTLENLASSLRRVGFRSDNSWQNNRRANFTSRSDNETSHAEAGGG